MCTFTGLKEDLNIPPKKSTFKKAAALLLWLLLISMVLLLSCLALVFIYEREVKGMMVKELNKHLKTQVCIDPKNIDLTFISSFPKCAVEFRNFAAMETWNKRNRDTLLYASSLSLQFNISDLFNKKYVIERIALKEARCEMKVDQNGMLNYEVWKNDFSPGNDNDSLSFQLKEITLSQVKCVYRNHKTKVKMASEIRNLSFSGNFSEQQYSMAAKGMVRIASFETSGVNYIANKDLRMDVEIDVNKDKYTIHNAELTLNRMQLSALGSFTYGDSLRNMELSYDARKLDIEAVLSLLPERYKNRVTDYKSKGEFYIKGLFSRKETGFHFQSHFGIKNAKVEYIPGTTSLDDLNLNGEIVAGNGPGKLTLNNINAVLKGNKIHAEFSLSDFNFPYIDASARGKLELKELLAFWPLDTLEKLEGSLDFEAAVKGSLSEIKQQALSDKVKIDLTTQVKNLRAQFKNDKKELSVENCRLYARDGDVKVEGLKLVKGNTDINVDGEIPGLFSYLLDRSAPLSISGKLQSNKFDPDDFMYSSGNNSELNIPANLQLQLVAKVDEFVFRNFMAKNILGNFELRNKKMMINDMRFDCMEGKAEVDALADATGKKLQVNLLSKIEHINVRQMFQEMNNFGQVTLTEKNVEGFINAEIEFSGQWDKMLNADMKSIASSANIRIEKGELNDFKPLESLSKFVDLRDLRSIKFASLTSTIHISDQKINIPKTTIKNSALDIDFSGWHDFSNNIDYHIRLLISDLLAKKRKTGDEFGVFENDGSNRRSAFLLMTGNIDNIKIQYDKQGLKQKIKEDIKQEKQTLKQLLKEEFGAFKKDSIKKHGPKKADQRFELEKPDHKKKKDPSEQKKEEDDDDF